MDILNILVNALAVVVPIGVLTGWAWSRLDKKFDSMSADIKLIQTDIRSIESRLSRLEAQDEERFRNEIKLLVSRKESHS